MRAPLFAVMSLCSLTACDGYQPYLPDGGRGQVNCSPAVGRAPVRVWRLGVPSTGATLTARNASDGRQETAVTDFRGVAFVTDALGPGVVKVTATLNDLVSPEGDLTFVCGECTCVATPHELFLELN